MGEMTPAECWVKESNHGEPTRAGLKSWFKDSKKMVANRLNVPVGCIEFDSIQNRFIQ